MANSLNHKKDVSWIFILALIGISVIAYSAVLLPREIPFIKTLSVLTRYNATRFLPFASILLIAAFSIKNQRLSTVISALVFFPLFSFALNGLWAGAYSENYVLSGLVPRSDAYGFYTGAISLMETGTLSSIAMRRPLYGGFLAFILWICGGNLQIALAIIVYLTAAVCFFSVIAVRNFFNSLAAVVYFFVIFFFIRRFIGITMSENLGFFLGISSFTCFLIALDKFKRFSKNSIFYFLFASFLFSLSQAARPAAVVTLPLLILFTGWLWRGEKRFSWKWMIVITIVLIAGFMINTLIFNTTSPANSSQISNIGYGVYGLAVGGKGWEQIFTDHPEINLLGAGIRERRITEIIIQEITAHPENFIKGLLAQFKILFSFHPTNSLFSFMVSKNNIFTYGLISTFFLLTILGIIAAVLQYQKPIGALILLLLLGFLFSLPFAPAYQTRYMRVYASSIFLLGFLSAFGTTYIQKYFPKPVDQFFNSSQFNHSEFSTFTLAFSALLLIVIIGGPFMVKFFSPSEIPNHGGCLQDQSKVVLSYYPGSSIHILKNSPDILTWVPRITQLDYKGSIHNICCGDEITYFENIPAPSVLYPTINLLDGKALYMIADSSLLPLEKSMLQICGRIEDVHGELSDQGFLYPQSVYIFPSN
jgi:hypothetical protein